MIKTTLVGDFGEAFIGHVLYSMGYQRVDRVNDNGIDLACYKDDCCYGISVKCRNIQFAKNDTINLTYNDIVYTYDESKIRKIIPAYAFVVADLERIDVLIVTQEYVFEKLFTHKDGIYDIENYKNHYTSKKDSGSTKSIDIKYVTKEQWKVLKNQEGVIFTHSYFASEVCI